MADNASCTYKHLPVEVEAANAQADPQRFASSNGPVPAGGRVDSSTLLRGRNAVEISHNGATYRLQATRLGKLILTK